MKRVYNIAFIVSKPFGYSETFLKSDCETIASLGHNVEIYPLSGKENPDIKTKFKCHYPPFPLSSNLLKRLWQSLIVFTSLLFLSTRATAKFLKLERNGGTHFKNALAKAYSNAHLLKASKPDFLIFGYGNLAIERENIGQALQAKTIIFFQGSDLGVFPITKGRNCYKKAFNKIDKLVFRSYHLYKLAKKYGVGEQAPKQFIFNKIDTNLFSPKSNLGQLDNPPRLIAVTRLHWIKGLNYLILGLNELKKKSFPFKLTIIGEGEEFEHLYYIAMTQNLLDWIEFKDKMTYEEVQKAMSNADMLVHPSLFESNGRVLLEAQASGLLTVSSNWEGAETIVKDQKTGWLFQKRNPQDLSNKIHEVFSLPLNKREEICQNAIEHVQTNFNLKDDQKDFENLFSAT
jgi:colanic acid/amylovoran biosynthesis glycosyltransferase